MVGNLDSVAKRQKWYAYYTEKRIVHQWLQVSLLEKLPVRRVVEIGPYLGLVTAMLANAGYEVTTLDIEDRSPGIGASHHIPADVRNFDPASLPDADALICCETLEHIAWPDVPAVLKRFSDTQIPWLILSVPYEGAQLNLQLYLNRFGIRRRSGIRLLRFLRRYKPESMESWEPHKWEIGYRGYSVDNLRNTLLANGWEPVRQEFTGGTRSIFLVCRNKNGRSETT